MHSVQIETNVMSVELFIYCPLPILATAECLSQSGVYFSVFMKNWRTINNIALFCLRDLAMILVDDVVNPRVKCVLNEREKRSLYIEWCDLGHEIELHDH